ncbi:hypothetical protein ABW21_db0202003 [Orbilia brochopaga]|nr:hypothetical protein ABW21_db0202003 [Drechslerella brochopaga]
MISAILGTKNGLNPWIMRLRVASKVVAMSKYSVMMYFCSRKIIQSGRKYPDAAKELKAKGLILISGPCCSHKATKLTSDIVGTEWIQRLGDWRKTLKEDGSPDDPVGNGKDLETLVLPVFDKSISR